MKLALPIIQGRNVWHEPLAFAHTGIMCHEYALDGDAVLEEFKFFDLFQRIIAAIEECQIDLYLRVLLKPARNYLVRQSEQRSKAACRLRRGAAYIFGHSLVN